MSKYSGVDPHPINPPLNKIYCFFCNKWLMAINTDEVEMGEHEGYIFVHDEEVDHPDWYFDLDNIDLYDPIFQ